MLNVLRRNKKARVYHKIDEGFAGFEPGAMWEDLKVSLEHLTRWDPIAIGINIEWIKAAVRCFLVASDDQAFLTCRGGPDTRMDFCLIGR